MARPLLFASPMLRGDDVVALQKLIGTPSDGVFGPKTATELRRFQSMNGLRVDGIASVEFQKRFGLSGEASPFVRPGPLSPVTTPAIPQDAPPPAAAMKPPIWKKILAAAAGAALVGGGVLLMKRGSTPRRRRR